MIAAAADVRAGIIALVIVAVLAVLFVYAMLNGG